MDYWATWCAPCREEMPMLTPAFTEQIGTYSDDEEVSQWLMLNPPFSGSLRIGTIVAVQTEEKRLLHTGSVQPSVDFGRLEQVFIVLQRAPTMDLLYAGEGDAFGPEGDSAEAKSSR